MDLREAMSTLRAVRRLRPDPIPDDVLERVLEAASWAPTGGNVQPFRMVVVREPDIRARLGELYAARWADYAASSRAAVADAEDAVRRTTEKALDAGDYLAAHWHEAPAIVVFCFDPRRMAITDAGLDRPTVVGGGSVYPAVQNLLLAARAEGLGCVLTTLLCYDESDVKDLLDIPPAWGTCAHVPLGWPVRGGHGPLSRRPLARLAWADRWGAAWGE
jgi:nitroreductase